MMDDKLLQATTKNVMGLNYYIHQFHAYSSLPLFAGRSFLWSVRVYRLFIYLFIYYKIGHEVHERQTYSKNNENNKSQY